MGPAPTWKIYDFVPGAIEATGAVISLFACLARINKPCTQNGKMYMAFFCLCIIPAYSASGAFCCPGCLKYYLN